MTDTTDQAAPPPILNEGYEVVPIGSLQPHPRNARNSDEEAIAESLKALGFYGALIVERPAGRRKHGRIVIGEHRWKQMREQGAEEIPVIWVGADEARALQMMLADNRATDRSAKLGYDRERLDPLLAELQERGQLEGTGFDRNAVEDILARSKHVPSGGGSLDPDDVPEADLEAEATTKPGDVWLLGDQLLICGDATDDAVLARLRDGKVDVVFTDPPYGMALETDYKKMHRGETRTKWGQSNTFDAVVGDDAPFDARPILEAFADVPEQFWWGADYYRDTIPLGGSWVVWDKRSFEPGDGTFDNVHGNHFELCWSMTPHRRELARITWSGIHGVHSPGEEHRRVHPTQKPVALMEWFFDRWVPKGNVIVDPYAGSGATLIAAERNGRVCRTVELLPIYCDIICTRWQRHTGRKPVLEATGEEHTFHVDTAAKD